MRLVFRFMAGTKLLSFYIFVLTKIAYGKLMFVLLVVIVTVCVAHSISLCFTWYGRIIADSPVGAAGSVSGTSWAFGFDPATFPFSIPAYFADLYVLTNSRAIVVYL